jgi:hypothetical protein
MKTGSWLAAYTADGVAHDLATKLASGVASSATPDIAFGLASHVALIRMVWRNFRAAMSGAEKLNLLRGNACPAKKMTIGGCADANRLNLPAMPALRICVELHTPLSVLFYTMKTVYFILTFSLLVICLLLQSHLYNPELMSDLL